MLPIPDEHAGDDTSHYAPTSRAKGQALGSQGPESLQSRSDRGRPEPSGARSPDRHRRGDVVMYVPQSNLARGNLCHSP